MKVDGRFRYTSSEILPALFLILAQQETCLSIRIITPNYWCCIILWAFCSSSPRVLLVSLKKFYCHCAVGRTIGKIRGPRHSPRCQRRQDLARRLQEQSKLDLIYSPPKLGTDTVPAPQMVSTVVTSLLGWPWARLLQLRILPGDISGFAWRCNSEQHRALGGCCLTRGNFLLIWKAVAHNRQNSKKGCAARSSARSAW